MFEPKDFSSNQLYKIDTDVQTSPTSFFFYSNGMHTLFIKRLKDSRYGVCGLGTQIHPLEHQCDCDVYYKVNSLIEAKKLFEQTISLLIGPDLVPEYQTELF